MMHMFSLTIIVVLSIGVVGCHTARESGQPPPDLSSHELQKETPMIENHLKVLQTSRDPKELQVAAIALARSNRPDDHRDLLSFLRASDFLDRLDSKDDYLAASSKRLRISRVLEALGKNQAPSARQVLITLSQDRVFLAEDERIISLLQESKNIRQPPAALVQFWDTYSQPDDGFTPTTITTLVENGSEPALHLLEKKMADPGHGDDDKVAWMRSRILPHRNDPMLLRSCERMLAGSLPERLRPSLVEVLFDYRPAEWYRPATVVNPPDRRQASPEAIAEIRKIGQMALTRVQLTKQQKDAVVDTLKEIGRSPQR